MTSQRDQVILHSALVAPNALTLVFCHERKGLLYTLIAFLVYTLNCVFVLQIVFSQFGLYTKHWPKQAHEISQLRAGVEQKLTLASACSQRETSCNQMLQMRRELSDLRADVDRTATKHNCVLSGNTIVERLFVTSRTQTGSKTLQRIGSADLQ